MASLKILQNLIRGHVQMNSILANESAAGKNRDSTFLFTHFLKLLHQKRKAIRLVLFYNKYSNKKVHQNMTSNHVLSDVRGGGGGGGGGCSVL